MYLVEKNSNTKKHRNYTAGIILVVMDNSLVQRVVKDLLDNIDVLILVVMDNSLVHPETVMGQQIASCLNPCCNGQ